MKEKPQGKSPREIGGSRPAHGSAAVATDKPKRVIEYHLEWSKNCGPWYFGGMLHTYTGAVGALRNEREDAARNQEGVAWRLVKQTIQRRILEI